MSVSVSETIGKLLLEGYKMLADSCDVCCTVLMQDRRGRIICVKCESTSMANSVQSEIRSSSGKLTNGITTNSNDDAPGVTLVPATPDMISGCGTLLSCEETLKNEIRSATTTLKNLNLAQPDLQTKLMYVRYIKECAETIKAIKEAKI